MPTRPSVCDSLRLKSSTLPWIVSHLPCSQDLLLIWIYRCVCVCVYMYIYIYIYIYEIHPHPKAQDKERWNTWLQTYSSRHLKLLIIGRQEILRFFTRRIKQKIHGKTDEMKKSNLRKVGRAQLNNAKIRYRYFLGSRICLGSETGPPSP